MGVANFIASKTLNCHPNPISSALPQNNSYTAVVETVGLLHPSQRDNGNYAARGTHYAARGLHCAARGLRKIIMVFITRRQNSFSLPESVLWGLMGY